ncbi:MAG: SCO family protein [Proteobacteria bacterium]|nr:SCO family protein [Pseudomonadota bacterium]
MTRPQLALLGLAGLAAVAVVAGALYVLKPADRPRASFPEVTVAPGLQIGGPFTLTDHRGRRVTERDFLGRFMLIYFGYTYCPDVCPMELTTMIEAIDRLGVAGSRVVPILITVDPARDTPAALADYVTLFDSRLVGLTGSEADIAAAAKAYRVVYAKAKGEGGADYLMDHSAFLYLMGPDGRFRAMFRHGAKPEELAAAIAQNLGD